MEGGGGEEEEDGGGVRKVLEQGTEFGQRRAEVVAGIDLI